MEQVEKSGFLLKPEAPCRLLSLCGINGVFPKVGGVLAELGTSEAVVPLLLGRLYLGMPEVVRLGGVGTS